MWVFSADLWCKSLKTSRHRIEKMRRENKIKYGEDITGITWALDIDGVVIKDPNSWNIIEQHDGNTICLIMCEEWCVELTDINDHVNLTGPVYDNMTTKDYNEEGI